MSLHSRSKLKLIRAPEIVGIILMTTTVISGLAWWVNTGTLSWQETTAVIRNMETISDSGQQKTNDKVKIIYSYHVAGRKFSGTWSGGWTKAATVLSTSAEDSDSTLVGVANLIGFERLPSKAKDFLRKRGVTNSVQLRKKTQQFISSGKGLNDISDEAKELLKSESIKSGNDARKAITDIHTTEKQKSLKITVSPKKTVSIAANSDNSGTLIKIAYDARNPAKSRIRHSTSSLRITTLVIFILSLATTAAYLILIYPAWKRIS